MTDLTYIENMKDGEYYIVNLGEEAGAEIWRKNGYLFLFEIPIYGGLPKFTKAYTINRISDLIKEYESWT